MREVLLIIFLSLFFVNGSAQQNSIRFGHIGQKEGLSQSDVNVIKQTSNGLLWVGTRNGLNAYNGFEFKVYTHSLLDSTSLSNNFIHAILEENDSLLWVGTENGLNLLNIGTQQFTNLFSNKELAVWSLAKDSLGNLWVGTDKELYKVAPNTTQPKKVTLSLSTANNRMNIRKILITQKEQLLIGTEGNGLIFYNPKTEQAQQYYRGNSMLKDDAIWDVNEDASGRIAIATSQGINFLDEITNEITNIKILDEVVGNVAVRTIFEDKSGIVWIGTENSGIFKLKSLSNIDHYVADANRNTSLSSNAINTIYEDAYGIIWIGTQLGLNKFDKRKQYFKHHQYSPNQPKTINNNVVWSIFQDKEANVWVGTDKGINIFDSKTGKVAIISSSASENQPKKERIYVIFKDESGVVYIGTSRGLFYMKERKMLPLALSNFNQSSTYSITEDHENRLWVVTKVGLFVIDKNRVTHRIYTPKEGLPSEAPRVVYKDRKGEMWLGTQGEGLFRVIEKGNRLSFTAYQHNQDKLNTISSNNILSIYQDKAGALWVGTYGGGLNKFDYETEEFTHYTEQDGLSNNVVYGILEGKNGNLWMSTNKGISLLNTNTKSFRNFDESDGLQGNEFNTGAYYKDVFGKMYFGGVNGFNSFYEEDISFNTTKAKPIITQFYLFNKPVSIGQNQLLKKDIAELDELILDYKQNVISFEFASLHYSYPSKNKHQYMLENFDEDWVNIGNNRRANYTNLDPGKYIFKVKGSNNDGVWSDEIAQIKVIVTPPFWETIWFFVIVYILLPAFIIYYIIQYRIKQVKAQKELLEIQVRERTREVMKQKELLEEEKEKSEKLLLNILPSGIADELRSKGKATARKYRMTSIMFTDFKGFTKIAEDMKPEKLVSELDVYFKKFDEIIDKYDIEKIKTIGDAYMCAGGLPIRNKSNPIDIVLAALEIQQFMAAHKKTKAAVGEECWELRLGVHTGAVVAGVIGAKRFAYDIWGDSVNIASRMEATGVPGKVNISQATYELVKEFFTCEYRGAIEAKNKGEINMYFVHGIKPELSVNEEGLVPNDLFKKYVDLHVYSGINYRKAERYIVKRLKKELPKELHYHDLRHTTDVCAAVERLALMEGIEGDDIFLLKTAALYHDAGFVKQYANNEPLGADLAQEVLPQFGYTQDQIDVIKRLILATKVPQKPQSHLEQIICDADLDYLGGDEFHFIADKLKRELMERDIIATDKQWDELQVKFLEAHTYFTKTAIELRRANKQKRVEEVKERLKTYD